MYHLIMEARHFVATLWSSVQFWLCCCVCLSLMQVLAVIFMLPGLLTTGQVLWFVCIVIPLLSVSLMVRPVDPDVMKKPQGKIQVVINWDSAIFIIWSARNEVSPNYCSGFGISLLPYLICINNCTCAFFYNPVNLTETVPEGRWDEDDWTLSTARLILSFVILLHFVVVSIGFVHRDHLIYKKIVSQSVYSIVIFNGMKQSFDDDQKFQTPLWVIIFAGVSPVAVLIVNEVIKRQEIMMNKGF
ncbi:hypothetical protein NQ317_003652 [Molorchus minor]|uniref:Uncharacterized protein n=1 Tax=Molorchus minor TaxID=1323400 RepID=A0ABQ9JGF9_9CUCU|nr:hypothetical protein NQ317_003652 [Molorchus minor]